MSSQAIADRYARAMIELGKETDQVQAFADDLKEFGELLDEDNGLFDALSHPAFAPDDKLNALNAVLCQTKMDKHSQNFLRLVLQKGRFRSLPAITKAYLTETDALMGRVQARVVTATELSDGMAKELQQALEAATGKTVVLASEVDPTILGGVIAYVGGRVIDASLRTRMLNLRTQLLNTNPDLVIEAK